MKENNTFIGFQIASSPYSSGPWNFIGPDNTYNSYYGLSAPLNKEIIINHKNIRYFKYKIFLGTCDYIHIPTVDTVYIYYSPSQ
ncbi:MAG: hypothetical protein QXD43_05755 [Candidatus Aenigmatarchaeota archaeon]